MSPPATKPLRILVAEDEPAAAMLLVRLLGKLGHQTVTVTDGDAAFSKATREQFDLIFLDWMLPKLDGIEVMRRATGAGMKTPAIVMSVIEIALAREHARAAGARAFLTKPVEPAELSKAIAEALTAGKPGAATPTLNANDRHPIVATEGWAKLPNAMGVSLSTLIGESLTARAAGDGELNTAMPGSECLLVDPARGLEFRLGVFLESAAAVRVTSRMLEEPSPAKEDVDSMVVEMSNVLAGAVKACCQEGGGSMTMCLPVETSLQIAVEMSKDAVAVREVVLEAGDTRAVTRVAVRMIGARAVRVEELREGHVLAEDMRNDSGALVLPACTRLTTALADRLRGPFKGKLVKVVEPDRRGVPGNPSAAAVLAR